LYDVIITFDIKLNTNLTNITALLFFKVNDYMLINKGYHET